MISAAPTEEWSYIGGTQAGARYSTLDEINRDNIAELETAWVYRTGELERYGEALESSQAFQKTPTIVAGAR